jgi:hypothetical protein
VTCVREALGLRVRLEQADDPDFRDYEFLISFRPQIDWPAADGHCLDGFADMVAKYLAQNGMKIARLLDFGKAGTPRVEYDKKDLQPQREQSGTLGRRRLPG